MGCVYCELRDGQRGIKKVYKDESTFAVLHPNPAVPGHVVVMPKEHVTILEQLSDFEVEQLFTTANTLSKILFEERDFNIISATSTEYFLGTSTRKWV